jgi:hypothetical protein
MGTMPWDDVELGDGFREKNTAGIAGHELRIRNKGRKKKIEPKARQMGKQASNKCTYVNENARIVIRMNGGDHDIEAYTQSRMYSKN